MRNETFQILHGLLNKKHRSHQIKIQIKIVVIKMQRPPFSILGFFQLIRLGGVVRCKYEVRLTLEFLSY